MTKPHTIKFLPKAAEVYESLRKDKQTISKIQSLLESISEKYDEGIGKPERLKGFGDRLVYSRHINQKDRITYEAFKEEDGEVSYVSILTFKGHYDDH